MERKPGLLLRKQATLWGGGHMYRKPALLCILSWLDNPQHTPIAVIKNQDAALASDYKVPFSVKRNRTPAVTLSIA